MERIEELNRQWELQLNIQPRKPEPAVSKAPSDTTEAHGAKENRDPKAPSDPTEAHGAKARRPSLLADMALLLVKITSIALIFILLFTFLFGIIRYQEPAMSPAIKDGDLVLFYQYTSAGYLPQDVIILEYGGRRQARRVVATAGDTVDITEAGLIINGALQSEPEIFQNTERYQEGVSFPLIVPEGCVFVLGDSRAGATDSRVYGCVRIEDTLGKVMTVIRRRGI